MIINLNEPFYSYDKMVRDAKCLEKQYDGLVQCVTIGSSHDNRDILLVKLGIGQKHLICCSGVHGRETINTIVIMSIIEYYADYYVNHKKYKENVRKQLNIPNMHLEAEYEHMVYGACIYELLQTFTILFIPLLNPDGYMIALEGYDAIRNETLREKCIRMKYPYAEWKLNARGKDINRNFPSRLWKAKGPKDYVASENETLALISVFHEYPSKGFIDFHSRGKSIYYYRSMMSERYNERQFILAKHLKNVTNYMLVPPEEEVNPNDTGGNTVHYYSEHFKRPAFTIETVAEEETFPLNYKLRKETFLELKHVIFEFGSLII